MANRHNKAEGKRLFTFVPLSWALWDEAIARLSTCKWHSCFSSFCLQNGQPQENTTQETFLKHSCLQGWHCAKLALWEPMLPLCADKRCCVSQQTSGGGGGGLQNFWKLNFPEFSFMYKFKPLADCFSHVASQMKSAGGQLRMFVGTCGLLS